jgi:hypothetical protein
MWVLVLQRCRVVTTQGLGGAFLISAGLYPSPFSPSASLTLLRSTADSVVRDHSSNAPSALATARRGLGPCRPHRMPPVGKRLGTAGNQMPSHLWIARRNRSFAAWISPGVPCCQAATQTPPSVGLLVALDKGRRPSTRPRHKLTHREATSSLIDNHAIGIAFTNGSAMRLPSGQGKEGFCVTDTI